LLDDATDSADIARERTAYRRHPLLTPRSTDRALELRPGSAEIREREPQARESFPERAPRASSIDPTAEAAVRFGDRALLKDMVQGWNFFRTTLDNLEMVLSKSDMLIAAEYATLVADRDLRTQMFARLRNAWQVTHD